MKLSVYKKERLSTKLNLALLECLVALKTEEVSYIIYSLMPEDIKDFLANEGFIEVPDLEEKEKGDRGVCITRTDFIAAITRIIIENRELKAKNKKLKEHQ